VDRSGLGPDGMADRAEACYGASSIGLPEMSASNCYYYPLARPLGNSGYGHRHSPW